jgi:hypothetical protein
MVSQSIKKRIESLVKGDIAYVKANQRTYRWYSAEHRCDVSETITPETRVRVNNSTTPYVFKQKGKHQCFLSGYALINGEEYTCGIAYENVDVGRAERMAIV